MTEHIISDECLTAIWQTCYEAGKLGREVYTVRTADGPEIVRCRDCKHVAWGVACGDYGEREVFSCFRLRETSRDKDYRRVFEVNPDGYCAWGERE